MNFSQVKLPSNQSFGRLFVFVFIILGSISFYNGLVFFSLTAFCMSFSILIIVFTKPSLLYPFNLAWMYFGYLLSKVTSPLILGIIYFIFLMPLAIFLKMMGRDELNLKIKKINCNSYYISRDDLDNNQEFEKQY